MKLITSINLTIIAVCIALMVGWVMNVVAILGCDFASPYKCEAIRIIGVPVAPLGGVVGYLDLGK